jgi:hypothetical protein
MCDVQTPQSSFNYTNDNEFVLIFTTCELHVLIRTRGGRIVQRIL